MVRLSAAPLAGLGASFLAAFAGAAMGAEPDVAGLDIRPNRQTGMAGFVTAKGGGGGAIKVDVPAGRARLTTLAFLDQYGPLMGIADPVAELKLSKVEPDALGFIHTGYQQVFKGVEVFSGVVRVHQDGKGAVLGMNGDFYPIKPTLGVVPTIDAAGAEAAARKAMEVPAALKAEMAALTIVDPGWYGDPGTGARLAYHVILSDAIGNVREAMFIDAHTGEVLDSWSLIEQLIDRETYDAAGGNGLPGPLVREEGDPSIGNPEADAAHDYAGDFYRYLQRGFGRDSLDNNGFTLRMTVNSTAANCPNAFWNGFQSVYCSGVVTDDIVGHELAHGLTGETAGLIYQNQSGQLNESFSDVIGESIDLLNGNASAAGAPGGTPWPMPPAVGPGVDTPNNLRSVCSPRPSHPNGVRWLIGEDASAFGGAIRDMFDPTCRSHPDRANSFLQLCQPNDAGGVHTGSGVPNHAYMLLVDGGTFNGQTISPIGITKAGAVWYRALTVYLTPASDFKDAYDALNQAAADLVGTSPNDPRTGLPGAVFTAADAVEVNDALLATEMNTDGACGQTSNVLDEAPPLECANPSIIYAEGFEGPSLGWTVANSAPPTPYNWVQTTGPLPFARPGKAALCEDRAVGNCGPQNESGTHSMTSPPIAVPASAAFPYLAFTHHVSTEGAFDGGRVELSINGGAFTPVPRTAVEFNPYNNIFRPASSGNTNPLAGEDAWSGAGGRWGRTVVSLAGMGVAGNSLRVRFTFAKDGCTGGQGWYVDDVAVYNCPDCDGSGRADVRQFVYRGSSAFVGPVGAGESPQFTLTGLPEALGGVFFELLANADLSSATEVIEVRVNGVVLATMFLAGATDCPRTPDRHAVTIDQVSWNNTVNLGPGGDTAVVELIGSADSNPNACDGSFAGASVRYALAAADGDGDFILDPCEVECAAITTQPQPVTVDAGDDAVFTVGAAGTAPLSYIWRRGMSDLSDGPSAGGGTISGSGTPALTVMDAGYADAGTYTVVVSNSCGPVTSSGALLTVDNPCPADFNTQGGLSVQDIFDFLAAYFSDDPRADFNGAGGISVQDIFDFLAAYFMGC